MDQRETMLTAEGLAQLKDELDGLLTRRPEIAERLRVARELGDISENAEYAAVKEEQGRMEGRISELERILNTARVIDPRARMRGVVGLGTTVEIIDLDGAAGGVIELFRIVGTAEADALNGKISDICPVGAALRGKKAGTVVTVKTPDGARRYRLLGIS
jgi:transcription elongation factor GreA